MAQLIYWLGPLSGLKMKKNEKPKSSLGQWLHTQEHEAEQKEPFDKLTGSAQGSAAHNRAGQHNKKKKKKAKK